MTVTEDISVAPDAREVARTEVLDVLDRYGHDQSLNTRCIVFVHGLTGDKVTTWRAKDAAKSAQPYRIRVSTKIIFNRPVFNMHYATPHCCQIVTFNQR